MKNAMQRVPFECTGQRYYLKFAVFSDNAFSFFLQRVNHWNFVVQTADASMQNLSVI